MWLGLIRVTRFQDLSTSAGVSSPFGLWSGNWSDKQKSGQKLHTVNHVIVGNEFTTCVP